MSEQTPIYSSMAESKPLYVDLNAIEISAPAYNKDELVPSIENGTSSTGNNLENAKKTVINNASSAADAVKNHPITQNAINGPIATSVKDETAKTSNEFSNLAASRTTPNTQAATGQPLTHYHSFFTTLLSWNNPRASGIAYAATVIFIFAARYLHILRYAFKLTWMTLGVTILAEVAGKSVLSTGLTSQFRPKKYFTLSKDTLNALVGDVHELINFFIIETQRIVFVENVLVSAAAFISSFISYFLIKVVPVWGLSLIGVSFLFLGPLIYKSNKELIDEQLNKAATIAGQQSEQMRRLASEQAARASSTTKQYVGDYSAKAQELIGNARGRSSSPTVTKAEPFGTKNESFPVKKESLPAQNDLFPTKNDSFPIKKETPLNSYKTEDFPVAPIEDFKIPSVGQTAGSLKKDEPLFSA